MFNTLLVLASLTILAFFLKYLLVDRVTDKEVKKLSINDENNTNSYKYELFINILEFPKSAFLIIEKYNSDALTKIRSIDFVGERVISTIKYNGPTCLDGTYDLRYNISDYGYTLKQHLFYNFELKTNENKILEFTVNEKSYSGFSGLHLDTSTNLNFRGNKVISREIHNILMKFNSLGLMLENEMFFSSFNKCLNIMKKLDSTDLKITSLNSALQKTNSKITSLKDFINDMTPEQSNLFQQERDNLDKLKLEIEKEKNIKQSLYQNLITEQINLTVYTSENEFVIINDLLKLNKSKKIQELLNS